MTSRSKKELVLGLTLVGLAAAGWFALIPVGIDLPSNIKVAALSPDFWPRIVMLILALSGGSVALQAIVQGRSAQQEQLEESSQQDTFGWRAQAARVAFALGCLFAFYFAIPYLGVVLGSMIVIVLFTRMLGQRSWWRTMALAVVLPVVLYMFFAHVAQIPIPLGWFESLR